MDSNKKSEFENLEKPQATIRDAIMRIENLEKQSHVSELQKARESEIDQKIRDRIPCAINRVPSTWYDASSYIGQGLAVLELIPDLVSMSAHDKDGTEPQQAAFLVEAAYTLVKLAQTEIELLEKYWRLE